MTLPSLPAQGSTSWYPWAQGIHNAVAAGTDTVLAAVSTSNTAAQNTTALNTAITAAATGGTVLIPPGTFDFNGCTLPAVGRVHLQGSGRGTTVLRNVHATNASITAAGAGGGVDPVNPYCADWTVSDLSLTASAVRAGQVGISVLLGVRFAVRDVTVTSMGVGVRHKASWECGYNTVSALSCTIGWEFPTPTPYTVSCPVTVTNGSAVSCGTAVSINESIETLAWHGGDFAVSTNGVSIIGNQARSITFTGVNFEGVTNKDVVVGDATTGPAAVTFIGCRFFRQTKVAGSLSVDYVRGVGLSFVGCRWGGYVTAIKQSNTAGDITHSGSVAQDVDNFYVDGSNVSHLVSESAVVSLTGKTASIWASSTAQTIPATTLTRVTLNSQDETQADVFTLDTTNSRITMQRGGRYLVTWHVTLTGGDTSAKFVSLYKNGTAMLRQAAAPNYIAGAASVPLALGDYIDLRAWVPSGTAPSVTASSVTDTALFVTVLA